MVHQMRRRGKGKVVDVVTPTGISALNTTYFTYAGWNPGVQKKTLKQIRADAMSKQRRNRMRASEVLIIDKISMLESNQFRRLDRACQAARRSEKPFGGIQVIVTGDFYQLPPAKPFQTCFNCGVELQRVPDAAVSDSLPSSSAPVDSSPLGSRSPHTIARPVGPSHQCPECGELYHPDDQWAFRSDT